MPKVASMRALKCTIGWNITTLLYSQSKKRIDEAVERMIREQLEPWRFMYSVGVHTTSCEGRPINIGPGLRYAGSSEDVFWSGYIEPCLERLCISEIDAAVSKARESGVYRSDFLEELKVLLSEAFQKVYREMVDVDRTLRGQGYPDKVAPRPTEGEIKRMERFLEERFQGQLAVWKSRRLHWWVQSHQFWIFLITTLLTLLLGILALC